MKYETISQKRHMTTMYICPNADGLMTTSIRYHKTVVVEFNSKEIVLRNDGYDTKTTKLRMNQTSLEYGLDYQVHQKDFNWYVSYKNKVIPFEDGMTLTR